MDREFPIKGRYIVAIWLIPFLYLPGIEIIYGFIEESEWYWFYLAYIYYFNAIFASLLILLFVHHKIDWRQMMGKPDKKEYPPALKLTAFVFIFSIAAAYALYYPLSYLVPEFVIYWYIDIPPVILTNDGIIPGFPNLLNFLALVVLAPVIEEVAFRGVLMHRWTHKYGMKNAIFFSSILFGMAHPDQIGAIAFGVAMCVLYLKTQTLIVPIICHAANNLVVWLISAGYLAVKGSEYVYTLDEFRSEWAIGLVCGVISILWIYLYINSEKDKRIWQLPGI